MGSAASVPTVPGATGERPHPNQVAIVHAREADVMAGADAVDRVDRPGRIDFTDLACDAAADQRFDQVGIDIDLGRVELHYLRCTRCQYLASRLRRRSLATAPFQRR